MMRLSFVATGFFLLVSFAGAQTKTITFEDARKWESLSGASISADGRYVGYRIALVDGDPRLIIRNADAPQIKEISGGAAAVFSDDSKWAAYLITPPKAVVDKLRDDKKPVHNKIGLLNLASGVERIIEDGQRFYFTKGGRFLVLQRYRPEPRQKGGSDLTVLDLTDGTPLTVGNVVEADPNESGDLIALRLESDSGECGVQVLEPATSRIRTLYWGEGSIGAIQWAPKNDVLAYLQGAKDEDKKGVLHRLVLAKNLRADRPSQITYDPTQSANFPTGQRITEYRLELNDSGSVVSIGIQPLKEPAKPPVKPDDAVNVEIWHTRDVQTIPEQKVSFEGDRRRVALATWRPAENAFQILADGLTRSATLLPGGEYALVRDTKPYEAAASNGIEYADYSLVSTLDGTRRPFLSHYPRTPDASRTGRYIAYFDQGGWWIYDIKTDKRSVVTPKSGPSFLDEDYDGTSPVPPLAGPSEWLADDAGLILHDQFDAWLARPGGNVATPLTTGRRDRVQYRFTTFSRKEAEDGVPITGSLAFTMLDTDLKGTGYYVADAAGKGKPLVFDQKSSFGGFTRAEKADRAIFTMQSFEKTPDLYVTNLAFTQAKPLSKLNPFQKDFAWPKAELVKYRSRFGKDLSGILIYPAGYEAGKTYPMVTYIYERLSDALNAYVGPNPWRPYNPQMLAQRGYFVYMPDITYQPRNPGKSAVDCLEPALEAVFKKKVGVDPKKVGLIGHSWGGYQTAYVTTVSKMFAVGVAGAPLTELTSMYNSFYWNRGVSDQVLFEISQGRMQVPFWEDPKPYIENSPVWQSTKRTAPLLLEEGDADGAVDYHQSLYLYQTLRRLGKNAVLLIYPGENHNLARRPNQLDYGNRLRHFLDVYLKGAKPEPWVTDGVPLVKQRD